MLVLGSVNVDSLISLEHLPRPGETVFGADGGVGLGGKGANQAVAAAAVGAPTALIGTVGDDADGDLVRRALVAHDVDVSGLGTTAEAATGRAYITVDAAGENSIIVVSGANSLLGPERIGSTPLRAALDACADGTIALCQGELSAATVDAFVAECARRDLRFVLNLAPVVSVARSTLAAADPLIVNEHEAADLLGTDAETDLGDVRSALAAVRRLAESCSAPVVVTLGADGAVVAEGGDAWHEPSPAPARVVDSTGAGDAFVGALVARLADGSGLRDAVRWGVHAGSLAVEQSGAAASYARLGELRGHLSPGAGRP